MLTKTGRTTPGLRGLLYSALLAPAVVFAQDDAEVYEETIPLQEEQLEAEADDGDAVSLGKIAVTGSRIKRTDYETANPVLTVNRDMIERSGVTSLGDLLQDLPVAGGALGKGFNNGGTGAIEIDLRNLGSQRVLVLVNGRRWVNGLRSLSTSSVDLTTIPVSIVERIDVLKDGASTTYGSDAIAGVVNIITRDDFDGLELRGQYGQFDEGDGETQGLTASWGRTFGQTSVFFDLNYADEGEVFAGDRKISRVPTFGTGNSRGSLGTPQGTFVFVPDPTQTDPGLLANECDRLDLIAGTIEGETGIPLPVGLPEDFNQLPLCFLTLREGMDGTQQSHYRRFDPINDPYNFAPINYLLTPNERTSLFGMVNQPLPFGMNLTGELLLNRRESSQVLAEMPLFTGDLLFPPFSTLYAAADQQFNTFNQDIGRADENSGLIGLGAVLRRMVEQGVRDFNQTVDTSRIGLGLTGDFDTFGRYFSWELGGTYAKSENDAVNFGLIDLDHARLALGPAADCDADPDCVPLNMFGGQFEGGTITDEMLDYIIYVDEARQEQELENYYFNISTELFELPAGPLGVAVGYEFRKEDYLSVPDPFVQAGRSSNNQQDITFGEIKASEVFAELAIPILTAQPFAESLELSLAGRYSDYASFGSKAVGKAGIRWQPVADLLVRGTASEAFRAPAITDLFLGSAQSFPLIDDPCDSENRAEEPNADQNCSEDGVPDDYSQSLLQLPSDFGGNPELKPETAKTFTAGVVYSPSQIPDLNFYVDWYSIEIEDFITVPGAQYIMDACYRSDPEDRALCDNVDRNADTGAVNNILNQFLNFATLETSGIDFTVDYTLPGLDLGLFKFALDASYLLEYKESLPVAGGGFTTNDLVGEYEGEAQSFPRVKANAEVVWSLNNIQASWNTRYIHSQMEDCDDGFAPSLESLGLCSHPDKPNGPRNELEAVFYHDIQFKYTLLDLDLDLIFGVDNVFDQGPPVGFSSFSNSFDESTYEMPGIFTYGRFVKRF